MKLYNENTDRIENVKYIEDNGVKYVKDMTDLALNFYGYYKIVYGDIPNRRYYTYIEHKELIDDLYTITYESIEKNIGQVRKLMYKDLEDTYIHNKNFAKIDTGLGFHVRASRDDVEDLMRGNAKGKTSIRDDQGKEKQVNKGQLKKISDDAQDFTLDLLDIKWFKFDEIEIFGTIDDCILYENTPYDVEVPILDEEGNPTGETEIVTRYKNNVTDWDI